MGDINEVAKNIYLIDDQLSSIPELGCVYFLNEEKRALIDSGPTTSASVVLDGIRKIGVKPEEIAYIIVTHLHLDHGGGAGVLLQDMPRAQVIVHHKGAKHLMNPARLISGVLGVIGEEGMAKYGGVLPIDENRVQAMYNGNTIRLSDQQVLTFIEALGHAPHELCIHESQNNGLFIGDVAGACLAGGEVWLPSPNVDPEQCINTIRRLMELKVTALYFAHFGLSYRVQEILQLAIDKLQVWNDIAAQAARENALDVVTDRLIAQAREELEPIKKMKPLYEELANHLIPLSAAAHVKYYQKSIRLN